MPCEIVAEIGASHRQDFDLAVALIHNAANCGADAVKFSMFTASDMTLNRDDEQFTIKAGPWKGSLYSLYEKTALDYDWIPKLKSVAESDDLKFIAGVYHPRTVQIALDMGIEHFKVASFEVGYLELLQELSEQKVYVSLGSASFSEIMNVANAIENVTLLKCTSDYPASFEDLNLRTIPDLARRFKRPVGLSDHSPGILAPVIAVAFGATVIEKHLKIDGGLDESFALDPREFFTMVTTVRHAEMALGKVQYRGPKSFHRKEVDGRWVRVVH
jgi:sialic acid synthase SpsE